MTRPCARCDWQPAQHDPSPAADQAAEHALTSGHRLCAHCHRSLVDAEQRMVCCERCLTQAREHLAGIVLLYDELPAHLGQPRGQALSGDRPSASDGRPLPGGDLLALLGPGSAGLSETGETTKDNDPVSVAFELDWWWRDWQETRGDAPDHRARSARAVVRDAAGYLEVHARWAATSHPGFDQFAADMRDLHGRLERATGRARRPSKAGAACFDCGGDLVRADTDDQGLVDDVTCVRCGRTYDGVRYLLALRAAADSGLQGWVRVTDAAVAARRSVKTIRSWVERLHVASVCVVEPAGPLLEGQRRRVTLLVWWPDLHARLHPDTPRHQRSA